MEIGMFIARAAPAQPDTTVFGVVQMAAWDCVVFLQHLIGDNSGTINSIKVDGKASASGMSHAALHCAINWDGNCEVVFFKGAMVLLNCTSGDTVKAVNT